MSNITLKDNIIVVALLSLFSSIAKCDEIRIDPASSNAVVLFTSNLGESQSVNKLEGGYVFRQSDCNTQPGLQSSGLIVPLAFASDFTVSVRYRMSCFERLRGNKAKSIFLVLKPTDSVEQVIQVGLVSGYENVGSMVGEIKDLRTGKTIKQEVMEIDQAKFVQGELKISQSNDQIGFSLSNDRLSLPVKLDRASVSSIKELEFWVNYSDDLRSEFEVVVNEIVIESDRFGANRDAANFEWLWLYIGQILFIGLLFYFWYKQKV